MILVRQLLASIPSLVLLLAAALPGPLPAQYRKYEGLAVSNIRFSPADQPLGADELREILPLKVNEPLRESVIRTSIERLFATGRYSDIQVDAAPRDGGVEISFVTKNRWFVGDISISGDPGDPPNANQLENASRLDLGAPFLEAKIQEAMAGQRSLLESNGLYGSTLRPSLDFETSKHIQQVNINFDVKGGERARFSPPVLLGDLKMTPEKIVGATKFRRWLWNSWKPVTQTRLRSGLDGIQQLYQKEKRLEAKVSLESIDYDSSTGSVIPTLRLDAGPQIQLNTIGAKVSQSRLRQLVPVYEEHSMDRDLLAEGARNLQNYFQSQGYFEADVQFRQQRATGDQASVDFLINTGTRHKLTHIEITGNHYFTAEAIRERMLLRPASFLQFRHGRYSESLLRGDEAVIAGLYQSNGFRDVKVSHRLVDDYEGKVGGLAVFIDIGEGPQTLIQSLEIEGVDQIDRQDLTSLLSSLDGQPFSEFNVAVDRDAILGQYFQKGFASATFEWGYSPADQPNRVNLRYRITEGRPQLVREAVATGLKTTRPALVKQNILLNPGDPLSPAAITDVQRRLYDLGVFAKVDAAIQNPDGDATRKYVLYNVEEARRYSVAAGFGAELGRIGGCQNCLDSPAGSAGFSPRVSLDLTRNNLWGVAHSISLRSRASTLNQRAILNYSWPRFEHNESLNLSFTGTYENSRDIRTANFRRQEVSAQISQRFSKATTLFYRFAYRRVSVSNLRVSEFLLSQLARPVRVGVASLSIVQDRRDDPTDPRKGVYNTLDIGLAGRYFGSQTNFVRVLARNASYYALGKRVTMARSTEFGEVYGLGASGSGLDAIPLPERLFGGGGTSHRGFPENQAGPRDTASGFPLGGTALFFNQTELRFPLLGENFGGVLFHDMGNVYSSIGKVSFRTSQRDLQDFDYMAHSVGFGIRYRTPIGPVRVDLGYAINPPSFFGFKGTVQELIGAGVNPCSPNTANRCVVQSLGRMQYFFSIGQTF